MWTLTIFVHLVQKAVGGAIMTPSTHHLMNYATRSNLRETKPTLEPNNSHKRGSGQLRRSAKRLLNISVNKREYNLSELSSSSWQKSGAVEDFLAKVAE